VGGLVSERFESIQLLRVPPFTFVYLNTNKTASQPTTYTHKHRAHHTRHIRVVCQEIHEVRHPHLRLLLQRTAAIRRPIRRRRRDAPLHRLAADGHPLAQRRRGGALVGGDGVGGAQCEDGGKLGRDLVVVAARLCDGCAHYRGWGEGSCEAESGESPKALTLLLSCFHQQQSKHLE